MLAATPYTNQDITLSPKTQAKRCNYCNADHFAYFEICYTKKENVFKVCLTCGRGYPMKEDIEIMFQQPSWRLLPNIVPSSVNMLSSSNFRFGNIEVDNNKEISICESNIQFDFEQSDANTENNSLTNSDTHNESNAENSNNHDGNNLEVVDGLANSDAIESSSNASKDEASGIDCVENEFSDHSDVESFAQLPESVFEAIEDTQDSVENQNERRCAQPEENKKRKARTCPICGKIFTASSSYFYHKKHFHERVKNYRCDVCDKKFGTKSDLVQHGAVHTDVCKFECSVCDKKFRSKASRYIHEQTHKGAKSHKCTKCEKSFRWIAHLTRHMQRHDAVKKHECTVCGRGFVIRCDLLRHARTHTVGSYHCEKCDVKFAQIRYLKVHMAKKHGIVLNPEVNTE